MSHDSFGSLKTLHVGAAEYRYFSLPHAAEAGAGPVHRLPMSLKILLENLLRFEDGRSVRREDILALGHVGQATMRARSPTGRRAC